MVSNGRQEVKDRTARLFVQREAGISDQFRVLLYHVMHCAPSEESGGFESHSSSPLHYLPPPSLLSSIMVFTRTVDRQH